MIDCNDLYVPMTVMQHVVNIESSGNPFAIGVVGGYLQRQPKNIGEAIATVENLEKLGFNYSLGIAQVNKYNLKKYGLDNYEKAFDICSNLKAGTKILQECYQSAGNDWSKAFSCYYSGNFVTGYRHGYVQKMMASVSQAGNTNAIITYSDNTPPIPVYRRKNTTNKSSAKKVNKSNSVDSRLDARIVRNESPTVTSNELVISEETSQVKGSVEVPKVEVPKNEKSTTVGATTTVNPSQNKVLNNPKPEKDDAFIF